MSKRLDKWTDIVFGNTIVSEIRLGDIVFDWGEDLAEASQRQKQLRDVLGKLFQAYQELDNDTMPEDTLPLEQIQDIMPEIEQALAAGGE